MISSGYMQQKMGKIKVPPSKTLFTKFLLIDDDPPLILPDLEKTHSTRKGTIKFQKLRHVALQGQALASSNTYLTTTKTYRNHAPVSISPHYRAIFEGYKPGQDPYETS